ncbi:hypothetical protein IMF27_26390 [Pseudomonas sp. PCH199]|uniref:hypothetical protein n=1 Tax=unclassified Pseudomonas TaxID=196821 RepID=UPI000BDDAB82|nr:MULTISPECIES: hypothetical protein [unclassified Pseudomonas]MCW8278628.1 hypothetical protein [Pseudomonas sp. PCH199]PAM81101.1 hypothetical protein CES87_26980 [Pseudomonas sp. ERMR1:02]
MELKLSHLRRWLFALCQARSSQCLNIKNTTTHCRSEPAREKLEATAGHLVLRVIVHDHREQARSYRGSVVV